MGAVGAVLQEIENFMTRIGVDIRVEHSQKTTLQGNAQILRKALEN